MTPEQYQTKTGNLASLIKDCDFVGIEEAGGREEVEALAAKAGFEWAFTKGKDTYTGENVAGLYRLPGWRVTINGRVAVLDRALSKHLLVTARKDGATVRFLVIHLLRPIGNNEAKHQGQLAAIRAWAGEILRLEPASTVVVLGDTNNTRTVAGSSILGLGREANELTGFAATHLDGHPYDRLIVLGAGSWAAAEVVRPPYPKRPNNDTKRAWIDHYLLTPDGWPCRDRGTRRGASTAAHFLRPSLPHQPLKDHPRHCCFLQFYPLLVNVLAQRLLAGLVRAQPVASVPSRLQLPHPRHRHLYDLQAVRDALERNLKRDCGERTEAGRAG
jgi:hypothetical protein